MTTFAPYRIIARSLAPLCASPAEGAQATELWQDKRDSLWLCLAVVLALFVNVFAQAAISAHGLPRSTSLCVATLIFTSSGGSHVQ
jgi:hypothetical protein